MHYDECIYVAYKSLLLHYAHPLVFVTSRRRHRSLSPFVPPSSHQVRIERSRVENTALSTVLMCLIMAESYQVCICPAFLHFLRRYMLDKAETSAATLVDDFTARYFEISHYIHSHAEFAAPVTSVPIFTSYIVRPAVPSRFNSYPTTITYQYYSPQDTI